MAKPKNLRKINVLSSFGNRRAMDTKALSLYFACEGLMINGKVRPRTGHENFWGEGIIEV